MLRLPRIRLLAARTYGEAAALLAGEEGAVPLAGGTDLVPRMKRGQQVPSALVSLAGVAGAREVRADGEGDTVLGAGVSLAAVVRDGRLRARHPALWQAAAQVASPPIRTAATVGGNLCLATRCAWNDQSDVWREAAGPCLKEGGLVCHVAPGTSTCVATSSTDLAPALVALGARARLVSPEGEREVDLADLHTSDGIAHLALGPAELISGVAIPAGGQSTYWKARRRGSIDFPVLGVAAWVRTGEDGRVLEARVVLGASAPRPLPVPEAGRVLLGTRLEDDAVEEAARRASRASAAMENVDLPVSWRRKVTAPFVRYALGELRGDDVGEARRRTARGLLALMES
ncbi:FAD binding domain-containing protein [Myxococcota bacterium]|nr:FAD binding domain-containing protein [Myxococcota bacterium]